MSTRTIILFAGLLVILGFAAVLGSAVSLSEWSARRPVVSMPISPEARYIDRVIARMSLRDKVAQLFILHTGGTDGNRLKGFMDTTKAGGFILMGDNIPPSDEQLRKNTALLRGVDAKLPRLIAIDEEGGEVKRLPGDVFPGPSVLRNQPPSVARQAFSDRSNLVRSVGANLNFGIVADVTSDTGSYIYPRVLGVTPEAASERVEAAVRGTAGKTFSTLKHFPGHGETPADSHSSVPRSRISLQDWQRRDMPPFLAGITAGADMVMFGHLVYDAVDPAPASLSKKWHDILRNDLQFKGPTITDDMSMLQASGDPAYADPVRNAVSALLAGNTILLYVANDPAAPLDPTMLIDGVVERVKNGTIDKRVIEDNVRQVLRLRWRAGNLK